MKPGRVRCATCKLRTTRPAQTSSTSERATCTTTRALRKRERRKPAIDASSFNAGTRSGFEDWSAGNKLKKMPVASDTASANANTRQSKRRSNTSAISVGNLIEATRLLIHAANNRPPKPPPSDSSTLSVTNCRTMRARLAPTARRIASSLRRSVARASNKFARLTQASSNTSPTTPMSTLLKLITELRMSGMNRPGVNNRTPRPSFSFGYSLASCSVMAWSWLSA